MRKLSLKLDDLQVESFHVVAPPPQPGTVLGHVDPEPPVDGGGEWFPGGTVVACTIGCSWPTCWLRYTCYGSCPDTCYASCGTNSCPDWECGL